MILSVDKYLDALLSFVPRKRGNRLVGDYVALIHVPAAGPERVYSLSFDNEHPFFTVANYRETVWELLQNQGDREIQTRPNLDALRAEVSTEHPVFAFLDVASLSACGNVSDGRPGMDYYLMLWQKDGQANVVECWEPYARNDEAWLTVVGALQALYSQYQFAVEGQ